MSDGRASELHGQQWKTRGNPMTGDQQTATLVVQQPLNAALKTIRTALTKQGLEIAAELDLAGRINKALRLNLPPCRVLCVDCPLALLEAIALDRSAAVLLPLHLVVAGQGEVTVVHLLNSTAALYGGLPITARASVSKLQARVAEALESVSTRHHPQEISA
jgi:uncharacterized protein (DUF302 family)